MSVPTIATPEVHDLFIGGVVAGRAAIGRNAGPFTRPKLRGKAQKLGCRDRHETVASGDAMSIAPISSSSERLIIERLGFD